jgi:TM2 domain-containing membrane protein YozV
MDMYQNPYIAFPGMTPEEMNFLQQGTAELDDDQKKYFYMIYSSKRKNAQDILLFTLLGFIGIAGVQRFVIGQIGMGILFLFTAGFCWIGTIVDLVNHKELANEYNRQMAFESFQLSKMGR